MGRGGAAKGARPGPQGRDEGSGARADEDGGLIGGASLKLDQFVEIVNAANQE